MDSMCNVLDRLMRFYAVIRVVQARRSSADDAEYVIASERREGSGASAPSPATGKLESCETLQDYWVSFLLFF
jgi:hypothetical protein